MNSVTLTGRLTRDIEVRYTTSELAIGSFVLAVQRGDKDKTADYIGIKCFGKTAEFLEKWTGKGLTVAVQGKLHVDSYEKDGNKHTFYEVIADRVEPIEWKKQEPEAVEVEQFYF